MGTTLLKRGGDDHGDGDKHFENWHGFSVAAINSSTICRECPLRAAISELSVPGFGESGDLLQN
jgi:hypothetical protein